MTLAATPRPCERGQMCYVRCPECEELDRIHHPQGTHAMTDPQFTAGQKHWSIKTALEQINSCDFECEAGPLKNNVAWDWLTRAAEVGPEFWPGQGVWFETKATIPETGKELQAWGHFFVVGCRMDSDTETRFWKYDLSNDPPAPWHYGKVQFTNVSGKFLRLEKP